MGQNSVFTIFMSCGLIAAGMTESFASCPSVRDITQCEYCSDTAKILCPSDPRTGGSPFPPLTFLKPEGSELGNGPNTLRPAGPPIIFSTPPQLTPNERTKLLNDLNQKNLNGLQFGSGTTR